MGQDWTFSVHRKKERRSIALPNRFAPANPFPTSQMSFQLPCQLHPTLEPSNKRADQRQVTDRYKAHEWIDPIQFFRYPIKGLHYRPNLSPLERRGSGRLSGARRVDHFAAASSNEVGAHQFQAD
jgi:hypothetical protein